MSVSGKLRIKRLFRNHGFLKDMPLIFKKVEYPIMRKVFTYRGGFTLSDLFTGLKQKYQLAMYQSYSQRD